MNLSFCFRKKFAFLLCLMTLTQTAHATLGGDDRAEILGIDVAEHKVFFTITPIYESGSDPSVYYFDLNKPNADAVFASSLYDSKRTTCAGGCNDLRFEKLEKIKSRLTPLIRTTTENLSWNALVQYTKPYPLEIGGSYTEHNTHYQILFDNGESGKLMGRGHAIYYEDEFNINQAYLVPNRKEMIVITEYFGKPYEMGYKKYDVVLLTPQ